MSILVTSDIESFFADTVEDAMSAQRVELSSSARGYLVGLLVSFARHALDRDAWQRPLTLLLREAQQAPPAERFDRLRSLGDRSLYLGGLFRDHLDAQGVDVDYVSAVGATAYRDAASVLHRAEPAQGVLAELATQFQNLVAGLHEVADALFAGPADTAAGILRVYDRWQRTGSATLGRELLAHGLVPLRGGGGVH